MRRPPGRRAVAAFLYGAPVGTLGGLIGLGGAEFRLPILKAVFGYEALRAVALNLAVSLVTLLAALAVRLPQASVVEISGLLPTMLGLAAGAMAGAAWGASYASRLPRERFEQLILVLLVAIGALLVVEAFVPWRGGAVALGPFALVVAVALGVGIGVVSSLLGVAGGELLIPTLVFLYGADVKVAGTASVMISLPTVAVGLVRYARRGVFQRGDAEGLIVPMGAGSILGALLGGLLVPWVPSGGLKLVLGLVLIVSAVRIYRHRPVLRIATTSSAHDTGLLGELARRFARRSGCRPRILAVGSGKALDLLEAGGADVAITHAPARERETLARGASAAPLPVMTNRYVVVGPAEATGLLSGATDVLDAMRRIAASGRPFLSRGDASGTHERETQLWARAGVSDLRFVVSTGLGMARTLRLAAERRTFTLSDRSTFLALRGELALEVVFDGNSALENVYSLVLPARGPGAAADAFADFLLSSEARSLIGTYHAEVSGEPLFAVAAA